MFSRADLKPCRRCHQPVRWTRTQAGKPFGVNPDPDPAGNTAVMRDAAGTLRSRRVSAASRIQPHERLMMPHVATCTPRASRVPPPPRTPPRPSQGRTGGMYDVLGVTTSATSTEIRSAYRRLARQLHPDLNPHAGDRFKQVTEAYSVLSDPAKRATYDLTGRRPR
ncbi:J domain-containing protein [Streptosporangium sp. NBC_01755]|uniref:J domain-containing protein n=1 Tax=Streptosporangium sp. NBC_01755 TaxID=2975949 RepID=UPI002DDB467A|nr:J domain-containing protein [Streptosporangium sp. NBC_01755]